MNRIKSLIAISAFSLLILGLPAIASAQWNGGYGRGGYGRDIRSTVENLRNQARDFENAVDRGNSRYDNRNLRQLADQFAEAAKNLKDEYGRGRDLRNSENEARRMLDIASQIDREINYNGGYYGNRGGYNGNGNVQDRWNQIRYDLQVVADTYGYSYNNRGNRNNRNGRYNRNGNWRDRVPFPLPF